MKSEPVAVLAMLVALTVSSVGAQKTSGCSLLTTSEIAAAIGDQVADAKPNDLVIDKGAQKGQVLSGCMWRAGTHGMVSISVIPVHQGPEQEAGIARLRQAFDRLRAKGWTEQKESFGGTKCSILTPPATDSQSPSMSGCMGEAKGMGIGVSFMSPGKTIAIPKAKALFDQAAGRLP